MSSKTENLGISPSSVVSVPACLQSKAMYGKAPGQLYRFVIAFGIGADPYGEYYACVLNDVGRLVFADSLKGFIGIAHG